MSRRKRNSGPLSVRFGSLAYWLADVQLQSLRGRQAMHLVGAFKKRRNDVVGPCGKQYRCYGPPYKQPCSRSLTIPD